MAPFAHAHHDEDHDEADQQHQTADNDKDHCSTPCHGRAGRSGLTPKSSVPMIVRGAPGAPLPIPVLDETPGRTD
ncbi:hypothetical protein GCM10009550_63120 [Actinocorallia libanotica]|uniref:Uncharacterized protein n=1 Tax=Actinocorallia libanotica TaxID=46162 RepID=A0ABN1RV68_9ACTN